MRKLFLTHGICLLIICSCTKKKDCSSWKRDIPLTHQLKSVIPYSGNSNHLYYNLDNGDTIAITAQELPLTYDEISWYDYPSDECQTKALCEKKVIEFTGKIGTLTLETLRTKEELNNWEKICWLKCSYKNKDFQGNAKAYVEYDFSINKPRIKFVSEEFDSLVLNKTLFRNVVKFSNNPGESLISVYYTLDEGMVAVNTSNYYIVKLKK